MRVKSLFAILGVIVCIIILSCRAHTSDNVAVSQPEKEANPSSELAPSKTVKLIGTIRLPGSGGFTDYLIVSAETHRLYAGYRTENKLVVVDTQTNAVVGSIGGLTRVCSVALVPELHLGFTSNRGEDKVGVIDLSTNKLLRKIPGGHGPDAIIYDEAAHLVCVSNHEGRGVTLIDPSTEKSRTISLGGLAEYAQADPKTGTIYQNLEDTSEVVVIDPKQGAVVARYKTAPGHEPTGLALDAEHHRLFSACGNEKLVVLNADDGKVITTLPIGSGVDFAAYDPALARIYTANEGSGTMTVIHQDSADQYRVLENAPTHRGGHALAVDPLTHRVYVTYGGSEIDVFEGVVQ
ncbi:MAG TPA: YncE family protein [Blastocatellia bacterium]|nr:YncE family protein [Blastocatellia bacterium]